MQCPHGGPVRGPRLARGRRASGPWCAPPAVGLYAAWSLCVTLAPLAGLRLECPARHIDCTSTTRRV